MYEAYDMGCGNMIRASACFYSRGRSCLILCVSMKLFFKGCVMTYLMLINIWSKVGLAAHMMLNLLAMVMALAFLNSLYLSNKLRIKI